MSAGLSIAYAAPADLDAIAELDARVFPVHAQGAPSARERLTEEMARPWTKLWVARDAAAAAHAGVVGFLLAWHVVDEVHVLNVATDPAFRRRGIARALVAEVTRFAGEARARHVLLEVRRSNAAAIGLYREARFFAFGLRRDYYPDHEDAIEMMLHLDPDTGAIVPGEDEVRLDG